MRKSLMIVAAFALVVVMAAPVLADDEKPAYGPGYGRGYGPGYGACAQNLSPEDQAKFDKARNQFLTETAETRKQIAAKQIDLRTELAQDKPDQSKVKALQDELVDLQAAMAKKRNAAFEGLEVACPGFGPGSGRGFGRGYGRGGWGRGGGFGPGNCPGGGPGFGRGRMMNW